jgi:hypothetical protein
VKQAAHHLLGEHDVGIFCKAAVLQVRIRPVGLNKQGGATCVHPLCQVRLHIARMKGAGVICSLVSAALPVLSLFET